MATAKVKAQSKPKVATEKTEEIVVIETPVVEEIKVDAVVEEAKVESAVEPAVETESKGEVVRETIQQLGIFTDYIYNVKHKDAVIVAENLGYGDVYLSSDGVAKIGSSQQRILFGESMKFEGIERLYFSSASQPVVQILEVK
jgi:hypothetical protein